MNDRDTMSYELQQKLKRVVDFTMAALVLILSLPLFALIALAIKLESPGEVIFRHHRVGKDGRPFTLFKFRSMVKGGDDSSYMHYLQELIESERNGSSQALPYRKMKGDGRVTGVGKFIRRFYLDELPQVVNVLRGEMSWVGPRPHVQFEVGNYTTGQRRRLSVKPGCTGLWQVVGKGNCTFSELIQYDLDYIDHWSLALDGKIILKTFLSMLGGGEESWARKPKVVPARKPAVLAGDLSVETSTWVETYTSPDQAWFIDVPQLKEEFANEEH